ncbi:MAG: MATE family efflux transporter [Alphaproteobacteria bacterium]|nr:MATE family efflux transporter [Alphaproteobacteria bacterium]
MSTQQPAQGRIGARVVLALAWPVMIARLSHTAMTVADTIYIGQLGTTALAAGGLASIACYIPLASGIGLLGGVRITTSHFTGAEDHRTAGRLAWQALWLALAVGFVTALIAPLAPLALSIMGASEATLALGEPYLKVRLLGSALELSFFALAGWFQGRGDTRTPMRASLLANGLNIGLDPLFIFGLGPLPALGLAGAALATSLSAGAGMALMAWRIRPQLPEAERPDRQLLGRIVRLGSPMAAQSLLEVMAFAVFSGALARIGDAALAAHVIVVRILSVSFLPGLALGEASGVLVGQALGAGRPERARQSWRTATLLGLGIMSAWAVVFLTIPEPLLAAFDPSPEVAEVGRTLLAIGACFQTIDSVAMIAMLTLQGAGDTRFTMVCAIGGAWLLKLPTGLALAFPLGLGAAGVWLGFTAELVVLAALGVWRIRGDEWLGADVTGRGAAA